MNTIEKMTKFVNQRPGLNFSRGCRYYGEVSAYRSEMAEITRDRTDYYELLNTAFSRIDTLNDKLTDYLQKSSGRLTLNDAGDLQYCTGQYFPTEYRPAANRVLANLIWDSYRDEMSGDEVRKALKRRVSRRIMKNYFN
jgi:hypothetical protein